MIGVLILVSKLYTFLVLEILKVKTTLGTLWLKIVFLLVSYYKLLNTNAQDCILLQLPFLAHIAKK